MSNTQNFNAFMFVMVDGQVCKSRITGDLKKKTNKPGWSFLFAFSLPASFSL